MASQQGIEISIANIDFNQKLIRLCVEVSIPEEVLDSLKAEAPIVEAERDLDRALSTLKPIEQAVIRIKYGYRSSSGKDDELVGNQYFYQRFIAYHAGISQPHVSRVASLALRKLKHPSRSRYLRRHVPDEGPILLDIHPGAKRIIGRIFGVPWSLVRG